MRIAKFALCAGLLVACSRKAPEKTPAPSAKSAPVEAVKPDAGAKPQAAAKQDAGFDSSAFTGTVRGIVKLAQGASLPLAPPVLSHGAKPPSVKPCPEVDASDRRVVSRYNETGGLSPIHIALTGMKTVPPAEPKTHELFIDACRLRPTLVGARKGDLIKLTNRSEMALVPQLPGSSFMRGLMRGESQEFEAKQTQTHVQCSFGSYCGETLVVAVKHPFYDVTTEQGFFTIEHVPLDQELAVYAWHPLFNESYVKFQLSKDKPEQMIEILLTPAPPKAVEQARKEQADEFDRTLPDGGPLPSKSRVVVKKSQPTK
ncbi:MAG TPA: hypothetical protein VFX59_21695 [Polyangiales bacterium]|nr:hypothetical protein [Polyangiales bacterium]